MTNVSDKYCRENQNTHFVQINHQPGATILQFIILTFVYSSTCFGRFLAHHQELNDCSSSLWFYLRIVVTAVLCSWSGRAGRPGFYFGARKGFAAKWGIFVNLIYT
jgi:hypothetical protein